MLLIQVQTYHNWEGEGEGEGEAYPGTNISQFTIPFSTEIKIITKSEAKIGCVLDQNRTFRIIISPLSQ